MPAPTTNDELLELVRKSGVQEEKKLDAYLERLRAANGVPAEPSKLAGRMVADGLLTNFQAEQLMLGKWRRFNIGKYKVLERLGSGGMGSVYLCEHKLMRRRVAVKVLPTAKAEDPSSLERFYREARAVAALDHPNIVRAYDIDQDENLHFLVMEYVDGASFQEIVKKVGALDVLRVCHYMRQAAQGLQHAHESAGIVHRDIKPGNILVDRNGVVKILDMGLARFFHDEEDILTKKYDENVLGTADYLAPEQALDSHGVDIRADIYSLGATFYYCLTGKTPFSEGTVAQKLIWHQTRQPKPIRTIRPEVPEGVAAIVEKMMAKEANQRYQTPQAVMDALVPWVQNPIGPPPAEEMPRLCPAAMGASTSEPSLSVPSMAPSGMPSPSPRKSWQVSVAAGSRTPTPSPGSGPTSPGQAAPSPGRDVRGSVSPPPSADARGGAAGARTPSVKTVEQQPQLEIPNGRMRRAPTLSAQATRLTQVEESVAWERLAPDTEEPSAHADTDPKAPKKGGASGSGLRPTLTEYMIRQRRRLIWVIGVVSAIVLIGLTVTLILVFKSDGEPPGNPSPLPSNIIVVHRAGKDGAISTLPEALKRAKSGSRIIVRDTIIEGGLADSLDGKKVPKDVTLEADTGSGAPEVVWRLRKSIADAPCLLTLTQLENFTLRGFTFDGEGRVKNLLILTGKCPGLKLENLKLKGFERSAVFIGNLEGAKGNPVTLKGLQIMSSKQVEAGLYLDIDKAIKPITQNKYISASDVHFDGQFKNQVFKSRPEVIDPATVKLP
jgi:serine/threonine protein kinase